MTFVSTYMPLISSIISFIFAFFVLSRYGKRKAPHLLLWGTGMVFYGIGGFCEFYYGAFGWNPTVFRLWYLFGAILVAAWLGQGTVFLLSKKPWTTVTMTILALGSVYAAVRVATAVLDPSLLTSAELSGTAIVTDGIRGLTPLFNIYGTLTLVGGAAYSAWIFFRKRVLLHRVIGNVLIAVGALAPAFGGGFSRFGFPAALYWGELIGAILMFIGFLRATTPMKEAVAEAAPTPAD